MNISKSASITVFLGCVFATQALATVDTDCDYLDVTISKPILDDYVLAMNAIVMNHGDVIRCSVNGDDSMTCMLKQSVFYGPDAILTFVRKTDGQIASIRVQQNYCAFEAGNITVKPIRGKWKYRTREGTAALPYRQGNVWLDQVSLDN
ncbi:MAG: hypothetical protein LPD71_12785 [Shewanella sp.]|nr:hypothetical protein [Shewanella sp.]MCF1431455.1 hypothetical protein [Shewanella sp.]MCF1439572.1 hypothetical protein [Shewanella sp.]MCF1457201.1 hypothetical protein [Shewanella sp.]